MAKRVYIEFMDCVGCQACVELCPDIFRMNIDGDRAEVIIPGAGSDKSMEECMERAINICPADCIHWDD